MSVAIIYGSPSGMTESVATRLAGMLGPEHVQLVDIEENNISSLDPFDLLIFGISTWGIGAIPDEWEEFLSRLEETDMQGKQVAIFGLGDQESYPHTFCDAIGLLFDILKEKKCRMIGEVPVEGYRFERSYALRDGSFIGLPLDEVNQPERTEERLRSWIKVFRN